MSWVWIEASVVWAIHEAQLAEHGGSAGVRDAGLLDSALARPQNLAGYTEPDAAAIASAYGFGIARNHPFIDGNKRTAWVCTELFLLLNGYTLTADNAAALPITLALASGDISEEEFAGWLRRHIASTT